MSTLDRTAPAYGLWSNLDSVAVARTLGRAGFDYVCLDLQHGLADMANLHALVMAVRAGGSRCVVRVPWNRPEYVMRALDLGAQAVIVPMVDTVEQATAAAASCRYLAGGARSWGPIWAGEAPQPADADAGVECFVMIETAVGLAAVEEIAAVPGLAGIYIGPNDLALSTGYGRETFRTSAPIAAMLDRIVAACAANGIVAGLHCDGQEMAEHWAARGVSMLTCATDSIILEQGLGAAQGLIPRP
ncbi:HpcH/HpaI aldolase family protein [Pengzhenrongella sicca]|uniref:Aldolase n=1 Tax=Pengzhenrongella sicca TaxID=2819238 RepID=A0A8A4Z9W2_9MICO|nr:aldolase/citrate lyase family protein [Pengzhenrongella sicca]QTE28255.1 aldolase [Pengzhenrongella sicca]